MRVSRRHFKALSGVAAILLVLNGPVAAAPQRIMSLKLCTDELLMDLAAPAQIASISYLSREKAALKIWPQAAQIPVNHNTPEEVLAVHPDMVLTDEFTSPAMREVLRKSGAKIVEVPAAESFAQIRAVTRQVGEAIGAGPEAEALIVQMDQTLIQLAAYPSARPIRVAGWGGGGFVPGRTGLFNTVLTAAGGTNIAQDEGGYYDVESLIAARPDVLLYGDDYIDTPSLRRDQNDHPVLLKFFADRRIVYPSALYGCGLPQSAEAAAALRIQLGNAMQKPGGVP
jgi:iron complex transport system substrate-binding protein